MHFLAPVDGSELSCRALVRTGPVVEKLIASATEHGAPLLATGTLGRATVARLFLGSVADGLLSASPVPVLTHRSIAAHADREPILVR
jgi:nucleotide-binding universal stress UspA family protein